MQSLKRSALLTAILMAISSSYICVKASGIGPSDVEQNVDALAAVAKTPLMPNFLDTLKAGPAKFQDYQCFCRLYTKKTGQWRDVGGAEYAYKYRDLFRAVIKTSDYRNGSVIVREPDGRIRGSGGGTLRFVKMTLEPDSRTLKLPTGYSLAKSDFVSLYDAIKASLAGGASGFASATAVSTKLYSDPVTVMVIRKPGSADISEAIIVNPKTKTPLVWTVFKGGQPDAMVLFEGLEPNKGLAETLFSL